MRRKWIAACWLTSFLAISSLMVLASIAPGTRYPYPVALASPARPGQSASSLSSPTTAAPMPILPMGEPEPAVTHQEDEKGILVREPLWDRDLRIPEGNCSRRPAGWKPGEIVTDERGYSCAPKELHRKSQCCLSRMRYSCLHCDRAKGCCFEYARCVSCCMGNLTGTSWDDCRRKCRTSSASLLELANVRNWDPQRPRFCYLGWRAADSDYDGRDESDLRPRRTLPECVAPPSPITDEESERSKREGERMRRQEASEHPEHHPRWPPPTFRPPPGSRASGQDQHGSGESPHQESAVIPPPTRSTTTTTTTKAEDEFVEV